MSKKRIQFDAGDHVICFHHHVLVHGEIKGFKVYRPCRWSHRIAHMIRISIEGIAIGCTFNGESYQFEDDPTAVYCGMCLYEEKIWRKVAELYQRAKMAPVEERYELKDGIVKVLTAARCNQAW